jgi:hypothetical protein
LFGQRGERVKENLQIGRAGGFGSDDHIHTRRQLGPRQTKGFTNRALPSVASYGATEFSGYADAQSGPSEAIFAPVDNKASVRNGTAAAVHGLEVSSFPDSIPRAELIARHGGNPCHRAGPMEGWAWGRAWDPNRSGLWGRV